MSCNYMSVSLCIACLMPLLMCHPVENEYVPCVQAPKLKAVDHSRGVYMHAHPNFPNLPGAPVGAFHAQYMHSSGGIGKARKRSLRMVKMFKVRC